MQRFQSLGGLVQRHRDALLVVLVRAGGVGGHVQRVQDAQDLGHSVGHTVVELLVSLALGALAVVVILGSGAEQLVLEVGVFLFLRLQLGLQGRGLVVVMLAVVLALVLFLGLGGLFFRGLLCGGLGLFSSRFRLRGGLFLFFLAHCGSLLLRLLALPGHALPHSGGKVVQDRQQPLVLHAGGADQCDGACQPAAG